MPLPLQAMWLCAHYEAKPPARVGLRLRLVFRLARSLALLTVDSDSTYPYSLVALYAVTPPGSPFPVDSTSQQEPY